MNMTREFKNDTDRTYFFPIHFWSMFNVYIHTDFEIMSLVLTNVFPYIGNLSEVSFINKCSTGNLETYKLMELYHLSGIHAYHK